MTAPPQVIRSNDGSFRVLNVDLDSLTRTQRLALAVRVWDQVRVMMEASGEYQPRDPSLIGSRSVGELLDIDRAVAKATRTSHRSVNQVRPRLSDRPDVLAKLESGEIASFADTQRALGMIIKSTLEEGETSRAKRTSSYYGKGDKFELAIEPIRRYLLAWRKKDYRFAHINPKEAQRRVKVIDEIMVNLSQAREDLVRRSHVATFTAPPEKTRRENS